MYWESKKFVTCFIVILTLLQRSGTKRAVSPMSAYTQEKWKYTHAKSCRLWFRSVLFIIAKSGEYWNGLPFPLGELPDSGVKPTYPVFPALQADSLPLSYCGSRKLEAKQPKCPRTKINTVCVYIYIYISPYSGIFMLVFSCVWLFVTPWTVAPQAPLSWDCPRKNSGVGCHFLL